MVKRISENRRVSSRARSIVMLAAAALVLAASTGCRGSRIVPSMTCDGVRSLRLGMSEQEVEQRLGSPAVKYSGPRSKSTMSRVETDGEWLYHDEPGLNVFDFNDKFYVFFNHGSLVEVWAFRKPPSLPEPGIYSLYLRPQPDGSRQEFREEGPAFIEAVCPGEPGRQPAD